MYRLLIALVPWVLALLFIALIAMAIGLGNSLGHGITEWHLP